MESLGLLLVVGMLVVFLVCGVHIAFAMAIVGMILLYIETGTTLFDMAAWTGWATTNSFILTAIPLFVLLGTIIGFSGIATELYKGVTSWIYWLPGKCLQSNIVSCAMFAAISGSSAATAATFAKIAIAPQRKLDYSSRHIYGSVAAGGTLGILIPPSIDMILYGSLTETSVPKLFAAGIIPGLILASLYMAVIFFMAVKNPKIAPVVPLEEHTWKVRLQSLKTLLPLAALAVVTLGGIYAGIFTPTEAASVGVIGALLLTVAFRRFSFKLLWASIMDAGLVTAWLIFILLATNIVGFALGQSGMAKQSIHAIVALNLSPELFCALLMVFYIILGCMLEGLSLMLLTVCMVFPIITAMGLSPIWFGVMMVLMAECALVTPPVGMILYIIMGVADTSLWEVAKGASPFVLCLFITIALLIIFPDLALLIPSMM